MAGRVLVIGAVNVDLVVATERLPRPGETVVGPTVVRHGGGKGANASVAAARAGAEVRYCGAVGSDEMGETALGELSDEGVDVTDVAVRDDVTTGMALIAVDSTGENQVVVGAGANGVLEAGTVRAAVERAADWAGCVLISTEIPSSTVIEAVQAAQASGLRVVVNPAPVSAAMVDVLGLGPVLTPNTSELRDLYSLISDGVQANDVQANTHLVAEQVAMRTGAPVVVTLGADGVLVADPDGETLSIPAGPVEHIKDTTGAGDTFNGVFAAALASGSSTVDAARRGVAAASMSVASVGARTGMPTGDAIDRIVAAS